MTRRSGAGHSAAIHAEDAGIILRFGAEMNVLRKHFSAVKGGRLGLAAYPAHQVTIYVSDVPPDQPSAVASGPTMPDESTSDECLEIVERYNLMAQLPLPYRRRLQAVAERFVIEQNSPLGKKVC